MVFSSSIFIFCFMPLFFTIYYLADKKYKNGIILAGSIFFYMWGAPKFIFVIIGTTIADFYIVRNMYQTVSKTGKMLLLCLSLSINLGLLVYFKYSNFFVENINILFTSLGSKPMQWAKLILPIGISFYTFETITYVVDVYRGVHKPLDKFWDYQLYIIFFPKLIAGPIVRYHDIADQIYAHTQNETTDNKLKGIYRFIIGLSKKVLIANVMGSVSDNIFNLPHENLGTLSAWMGALSYTMQIYFDFSGYSDMAIGLALMMGFKLPENFNNPYTAGSITEFWRRWHITLGTWMRNYLYIPLGGNKVNKKWKLYFNLWVVFLASGFWHGAAWGFIIWGAYHGFFLVIERIFLNKWLTKLGKASFIYTFLIVLIGWVFFRLNDLNACFGYFRRMFEYHQDYSWSPNLEYKFTLACALFFSFFTLTKFGYYLQDKVFFQNYSLRLHLILTIAMTSLFILSAARILSTNYNPFIYFQF